MIYSIWFGVFFGALHSGEAMLMETTPTSSANGASGLILVATEPRKGGVEVLCALQRGNWENTNMLS